MHEQVHSIFHSRPLASLRLPSLAGEGLPERMRTISFALLGLTAAAGLALVAIFATPGFNLISPAPLPDEPTRSESIAEAERLPLGHAATPSAPLRVVRPQREEGPAPSRGSAGSAEGDGGPAPAGGVPAPTSAPQPAGGNSGGGGAGKGTGGGSDPAPTAAPAPAPAPVATPVSSPQPTGSKEPQPSASVPKPEPAPTPGSSASAAAAEHASERGIEASGGSAPASGATATTASVAPEAPDSPGNGNGLAKGHDK